MASYPDEEPPSTEGLDDYQFTFSCSSKTTPSTGVVDSFIEPDVRFPRRLCFLSLFNSVHYGRVVVVVAPLSSSGAWFRILAPKLADLTSRGGVEERGSAVTNS
jgi:hypothetical protein